MIFTRLKENKIKAEAEVELKNWYDNKYKDPKTIHDGLKYQLENRLAIAAMNAIQYEVREAAKDLLFEILEDPEFKTGLKQTVRDSIKNRFKEYLDKV